MSALLATDGFLSTAGPYVPGGLGGGVGVNSQFGTSGMSNVSGALWVGSSNGIGVSSPQVVRQELHVDGPVQSSAGWTVGSEAFVNGDVASTAPVAIAGALHVPPAATVASTVTAARVVREAVTVPDPCDCAPADIVPIAAIVAYHATHNDDAAIGLDPATYESATTPRRLDLPCGRYYLTRIGAATAVTIVAHGRTALFVGGDVMTSAPLTITLDPTAELDVFVAGTLGTSASLTIGSVNYPALARLYIGSPNGFHISSSGELGANFYVPNGQVQASARLEVFGAVFAGDFAASSEVAIHFDRQVLRAGDTCGPTQPPGDAGGPACGSCRDCGNQACVGGRCGACTSGAQCCAPLVCWQGRCAEVPG
jgi:hypothetical protein